KTRDDLIQNLNRQLGNFRRSCNSFDEGHLGEAERMAAHIYTLCHDGAHRSRSKSLLGLLRIKKSLELFDTGLPPKETGVARMGPPMLMFNLNPDGKIVWGAPLEEAKGKWISFGKWWEGSVYRNQSGKVLTRKNLVFSMRSQDGGAHVDDNYKDREYHSFVKFGDHVAQSADGSISINTQGDNLKDLHLHVMRQMSWEVLHSLEKDTVASAMILPE
ncbi:MAG: hypothetical protein AAGJ35_04810, partial [Myxococcota bacterium]